MKHYFIFKEAVGYTLVAVMNKGPQTHVSFNIFLDTEHKFWKLCNDPLPDKYQRHLKPVASPEGVQWGICTPSRI